MADYKGKKILITGGMGFLGSNLAISLVEQGADVTILDVMLEDQGGNLFNIEPIKNRVTINFADVRDKLVMRYIVRGMDYVFHLAGQVNHLASIRDPFGDFDINVVGTLSALEACRVSAPDTKFIFTGTRGQYGKAVRLPVDEDHPTNPQGIYAISNHTAEMMLKVYCNVHGIRTVGLRITNTFGPRHQMKHSEFGVANWFIRRALDDMPIELFGDGRILRDFLYIDDTVDAMLTAGLSDAACGEIFNVGTQIGVDFIKLADAVTKTIGAGSVIYTECPRERKDIEPGDYVADITKIKRILGWEPKVSLEDGILRTAEYYRKYKEQYWPKEELRR